ncbi:MAG: F0F1 ATP synthase subunit A [Spirochaetota bacterium]
MVRFVHFVNSFISSAGAEACPKESVYDIVVGHVSDQEMLYQVEPGGLVDIFYNLIFKLNTFLGLQIPHSQPVVECFHGHPVEVIKSDPVMFLGVFDLRITKIVLMMWLTVFLCAVVFVPLAKKIKNSPLGSRSRWVNLWEAMISFVHDEIVEPNFGHGFTKKAMPYFLTLFFFVIFMNYLGQIPGMATATGNLGVTAGLSISTMFCMFVVGTLRQGPQWIFSGIVPGGIPFVMYFLLWPIEFVGLAIKPFALTIRLFANMTAGHVVIVIFLYLVMMFQSYSVGIGSVTLSLVIYMVELLVCFIQAYIFTVLSAMFIGSAVHAH